MAELYTHGETVWGLSSNKYYEAKIINVDEIEHGGVRVHHFRVHYQGWNQSHDEWILGTRLLKFSPENQIFVKNWNEEVDSKDPKKNKEKKRSKIDDGEGEAKKKKRKLDPTRELEGDSMVENKIQIVIPLSLRKQLVEDYYNVIQQKKLIDLPVKQTVAQLVEDYIASLASKSNAKRETGVLNPSKLGEVAKALQVYFDKALSTILLYRFERIQYDNISNSNSENKRMSQIYGVQHFLRLFVKLPFFLGKCNLPNADLETLQIRVGELLKFIAKQDFNDVYTKADSDYCNKFGLAANKIEGDNEKCDEIIVDHQDEEVPSNIETN